MLKIFNNLKPFFEDCYREFSVREYAKIVGLSPPTASKLLKEYSEEGFLNKREERNLLLFSVNRESLELRNLSGIYWREKLKELIKKLDKDYYLPSIVLFGSLSKLEVNGDSDIDLIILSNFDKKSDLSIFEKRLKRKIQLFCYDSIDKIPKNLRNNILNGHILKGVIS